MPEQTKFRMLTYGRIGRAILSTAIVASCASVFSTMITPSAQAAPSLCSDSAPGLHPGGLAVGDVTLGGSDSDDCYGLIQPSGQPEASDANDGFGTLYHDKGGTDAFTKLFGIDAGETKVGSSLDGFSFSLTDVNYSETGMFTLAWEGGDVPAFFDLVIGTKASTDAALYLFDNVEIFTTPSSLGGTYSVAITNNKGNPQELSNLTLFGRTGSPDGGITEMSQPSTLMLLGGAFLLIGWAAQRGRRDQV